MGGMRAQGEATRARPTRAQCGPQGPCPQGPKGPHKGPAHKGPVPAQSARLILVYIYMTQQRYKTINKTKQQKQQICMYVNQHEIWPLVLDPWSWSLAPGPWSWVPGPGSMIPGSCSLVPGPWCRVMGLWSQVLEPRGNLGIRATHMFWRRPIFVFDYVLSMFVHVYIYTCIYIYICIFIYMNNTTTYVCMYYMSCFSMLVVCFLQFYKHIINFNVSFRSG